VIEFSARGLGYATPAVPDPDDLDGELILPPLAPSSLPSSSSAPTVLASPRSSSVPGALGPPRPAPNGGMVALRGRIPAAAFARGTEPPADRVPVPPHSTAVAFGIGAGLLVEIEGDRVTLSLPTGRVVGTRAQTRDLIDALLESLTH